jgi:serine/threonine-protein kinase
MTLSTGTRLGRYEIRTKIGEGGMGEVYQATDTDLNRIVALKILPSHIASQHTRLQRFVLEAKAASALNHPHILTIYEIGAVGDLRFIATEFVDGGTLQQRIKTGLNLAQVLEIAIQIAGALSAAHTAGIVHRDIKSENIMVRNDGYAKLLDFGLAKLIEPESLASDPDAPTRAQVHTGAGIVLGTANYMSPEQAKGLPIDARTDLWSLGAVLYEMVTGHVPFIANSATETLALILQREPPPLTRYSAEVPPELERIIAKALTKDREERYQSAKDLLIDLRNLKRKLEVSAEIERTASPELHTNESSRGSNDEVTAATPAQRVTSSSGSEHVVSIFRKYKLATLVVALVVAAGLIAVFAYSRARKANAVFDSIAVLPFETLSSDQDSDYLSYGLTESLIYRLSQLPGLKVSPTSTVLSFKGKKADAISVGKELGVSAVLSGRIVQRGDNLTISAELVDVNDNRLLWGEQYDRKVSDLLVTQREIAKEIVENLKLKVSGDDRALATRDTDNQEAYQLYMRGRFHWNKRTNEGLKKAIDYFNQAIESGSELRACLRRPG